MNISPNTQKTAPAGKGENAATSPYTIIKNPVTDIVSRDSTIAGSHCRRGDLSPGGGTARALIARL